MKNSRNTPVLLYCMAMLLLFNLISNIGSLATRIAAGNVLYALAIPAMFCSIAGGAIGSRLALKRGAKLIRYVMLGVLALLTFKLAFEWITGTM